MNPLGVRIVTVLSVLLLASNRRWAPVWMFGGVLFLTQEQALDLAGFNITAIRLLEVAGLARIVLKREGFTWCRIDSALFVLYGYTTLVFLLRSDFGQAYAVGSFVDTVLCYVLFRSLLRGVDDVAGFLQRSLLLLLPYVGLLVVEALSFQNPFGALGARTWTVLREDRLRVMGSFRNPSLLGTLGATLLPLYIALWLGRRGRAKAMLGIALCLAIVVLANSGGPVSAAAVALLGWCCWPLRRHLSALRRLSVAALLMLALAMNAPVWYLLERVSFLTGGSGWHRAHLLSMAWRDIDRWWLAGMDIRETADWFRYSLEANHGGADITNAFLDFGLRAGIVAMLLFIWLLVRAFRGLGAALAEAPVGTDDRLRQLMLWGLGCTLAAHIATWMGITYFDQSYVVWYLQLAAIAAVTARSTQREPSIGDRQAASDPPPRATVAPARRFLGQEQL